MPYRVKGKIVEKLVNGQWQRKQKCSSNVNAHKALRLLQAIEHNPEFEKRS